MNKKHLIALGIVLPMIVACGSAGTSTPTSQSTTPTSQSTEPTSQSTTSVSVSTSPSVEQKVTITWHVGSAATPEQYKVGEIPSFKGEPKKDPDQTYTYSFQGWSLTEGGEVLAELPPASVNADYYAIFKATYIEYAVKFKVESTETTKQYHFNDVPSYGTEEPVKPSTSEFTFQFAGWKDSGGTTYAKGSALPAVTKAETYTALFDSTYIEYTIKFVVEGSESSKQYHWNQTPSYGTEDPTKPSTPEFSYTFKGWKDSGGTTYLKGTDLPKVTGPETYTALFTQAYVEYTVTFNVEGTNTPKVFHYNDVPSYGTEDPVKPETEKATFVFAGWKDSGGTTYAKGSALPAVTKAETYTALFDSIAKKYEIRFLADDLTLIESKEVEYDVVPAPTAEPTRPTTAEASYTFTGWTDSEGTLYAKGTALPKVSGDAVYVATFSKNVLKHSVKITEKNIEGTELHTQTIEENYNETVATFNAPEHADLVANKPYIKYQLVEDSEETIYYSELSEAWDGTSATAYEKGTGTEADPFIISNGKQLAYLKDQVAAGNTYQGSFFKLSKSINLNNEAINIGSSSTLCFKGTFDGNNCILKNYKNANGLFIYPAGTISNLSIEGTLTCGEEGNGAFGFIGNNCTLINCINYATVTSASLKFTAGIIGKTMGTLRGCVNYGSVTSGAATLGDNHVGGIVGAVSAANGKVTLENCKNFGDVFGGSAVGGIFGGCGNSAQSQTLKNCKNFGNIKSVYRTENAAVGGIIGGSAYAGHSISISGCSNWGDVTAVQSTGSTKKLQGKVGGIIGCVLTANAPISISSSYNYGTICTDKWSGGIAGYIALAANQVVTFTECHNYGTVTFDTTHTALIGSIPNYFGGIVGYVTSAGLNATFNLDKSSNSGLISGINYCGGLIGVIANQKDTFSLTTNITKCTNSGDVEVTTNGASGIIGFTGDNAAIINITNTNNLGDISADGLYAGGFIGFTNPKANQITIDQCNNVGDVSSGDSYAGGFIGWGTSAAVDSEGASLGGFEKITNSTNTGDIHSVKNGAAGFVGVSGACTNIEIDNCKNYGDISTDASLIGGIFGFTSNKTNTSLKVTNCVNKGDVTATGDIAGGVIGGIMCTDFANFTCTGCSNKGTISSAKYHGDIIGYDKRAE